MATAQKNKTTTKKGGPLLHVAPLLSLISSISQIITRKVKNKPLKRDKACVWQLEWMNG